MWCRHPGGHDNVLLFYRRFLLRSLQMIFLKKVFEERLAIADKCLNKMKNNRCCLAGKYTCIIPATCHLSASQQSTSVFYRSNL
jgi:hypothetical protein